MQRLHEESFTLLQHRLHAFLVAADVRSIRGRHHLYAFLRLHWCRGSSRLYAHQTMLCRHRATGVIAYTQIQTKIGGENAHRASLVVETLETARAHPTEWIGLVGSGGVLQARATVKGTTPTRLNVVELPNRSAGDLRVCVWTLCKILLQVFYSSPRPTRQNVKEKFPFLIDKLFP